MKQLQIAKARTEIQQHRRQTGGRQGRSEYQEADGARTRHEHEQGGQSTLGSSGGSIKQTCTLRSALNKIEIPLRCHYKKSYFKQQKKSLLKT